MDNNYVYACFKRGDQIISSKKHTNSRYFDGMLVDVIDPLESSVYTVKETNKISGEEKIYSIQKKDEKFLPTEYENDNSKIEIFESGVISDTMQEVYCIIKFDKGRLDTLKSYSQEYYTDTDSEGSFIINSNYRKSKKYLDWLDIENELHDLFFEEKIHSPDKIDCIDGETYNLIACFKDSKDYDFSSRELITDFRAISSGTYTIGGDVGDDYSTLTTAFADLANLTGDLYLIHTSDTTLSSFTSVDIDLNGYTLIVGSDTPHRGAANRGHTINCNRDGNLIAIRCEGSGNFVFKDLILKQTATLTTTYRILYIINVDASFNGYFHDLLFDGNGYSNINFFRIYDNTPVIECWNIKGWDGDEAIELDVCNSSNNKETTTTQIYAK
jgi:hypothetical protein